MYIRFENKSTFERFPQKLTKDGWDHFVDLSEARTLLSVAQAFCSELYSPTMGPLRSTFNVNYLNDMMTNFFSDHANDALEIAVFEAQRLWDLGGKESAGIVELLLTAHRHGAFSFVNRNSLSNVEDVDGVVNGKINLTFIT